MPRQTIRTRRGRKKLNKATGGESYIETVWGRGYTLRDPVEEIIAMKQA